MSENKNLKNNLKKFMSFSDRQDPEAIAAKLRKLGLDPDRVGERGRKLAEELYITKMKVERQRIKEERMTAQAKATAFIKQFALDSVDKVNEAIGAIRKGQLGGEAQRYAQAYFRNFKNATIQDKVSLLKDIELLKHLSQEK